MLRLSAENTGSGLDLLWGWNKANGEDAISWFNWFFSFFGLLLFRVSVEFWYRPIGDSFHLLDFSFPSDSLFLSFVSTSGAASGWTSGHFDFLLEIGVGLMNKTGLVARHTAGTSTEWGYYMYWIKPMRDSAPMSLVYIHKETWLCYSTSPFHYWLISAYS